MALTMIGARVDDDVAAELRRRAALQETTVSRVASGMLRRAIERDRRGRRRGSSSVIPRESNERRWREEKELLAG